MRRFFSLLTIILMLTCALSACADSKSDINGESQSSRETERSTSGGADSAESNGGAESGGSAENSGSAESEGSSDTQKPEKETQGSSESEETEDTEKQYLRDGSYIYLGEYPQSLKKSNVTVGSTADSRGYYLGSDNCYYAKVTASPCQSGYRFSNDAIIDSQSIYYFKVEPIKWRVVSESDGYATLLCESIIEGSRYDDASNNYKDSEIRTYLNGTFLSTAFAELEKEILQTVTVDNSLSSTGYTSNVNVCANTSDKVFLLSYSEAKSNDYGLSSSSARIKAVSDYARARGALISTIELGNNYGKGTWMLRTPNDTYSHFIRACSYNGDITDGGTHVSSTFFGVAPAIKIKL